MYESDEDLNTRREQLEGQLVAYRSLLESIGYKSFLELLKMRLMNLRSEKMAMDVNSTEQAFAAAKLGGRIFELEAIMTLPEFVLDNINADLAQIYHDQAAQGKDEE